MEKSRWRLFWEYEREVLLWLWDEVRFWIIAFIILCIMFGTGYVLHWIYHPE